MRNFDEDFVDNCYPYLRQFSIILMKKTVAYCDKTEQETQENNETKTILKQQLKIRDYEEIKYTLTSNESATEKLLQIYLYNTNIFEKVTTTKTNATKT